MNAKQVYKMLRSEDRLWSRRLNEAHAFRELPLSEEANLNFVWGALRDIEDARRAPVAFKRIMARLTAPVDADLVAHAESLYHPF